MVVQGNDFIHIQLIPNENGRLDKLIPIFSSMSSQGYGKFDNGFFVIDSNMNIEPKNEVELTFSMIQRAVQMKRIPISCYVLKTKQNENNN